MYTLLNFVKKVSPQTLKLPFFVVAQKATTHTQARTHTLGGDVTIGILTTALFIVGIITTALE